MIRKINYELKKKNGEVVTTGQMTTHRTDERQLKRIILNSQLMKGYLKGRDYDQIVINS